MHPDYTLYLVTDRSWLKGRDLFSAVEEALQGGVTLVQLREKEVSSRDFYNIALKMKELVASYNVPLIVNDRLDIALAVDAAGLHIGQEDLPLEVARRIMGPGKIIGYSASNVEEAVFGEKHGADYLGVGPVFYTASKADAGEPIGVDGLKLIKESVKVPVVGIGGIGLNNLEQVKKTGVAGVAVISAILGSREIRSTAREFINAWKK
ncbi:MAG TPA: thiamine phosphate synthase [Bacillota bacterium]|jgi:thiamine-phosphate pyrophosphorylase|nr:thiamine phosphate synthase [Peptococcaceae bacterium MAG4]NLW38791.1 thiamine phosphate synthase [Peptococcaceae bacterium]HPZ44377.1 thiamine phosphate synthase [Bacillota bacterium]HQD77025.1 thiamine phosphate synthase [Bacillota bacterium]HUM59705.1 thiamine phosphate synthase [Bacillota bacterium]